MTSDKYCCVPGCKDSGGMHLVLHGFPNPEKDRIWFNAWLYAIGGDVVAQDNELIHKFRRVCRSHFEDKYLCRNNRIGKVAVPTINLPDKGILLTECKKTADLLLFMDNVFNSVNGSHLKNKHAKPLLGPATPNSPHHKLWEESKKIFTSMAFVNSEGKIESIPTVNNWVWKLNGIQFLLKKIKD